MAAGGAEPESEACTQIKLCGSAEGVGLITIAVLAAAWQLAIDEKVPTWRGALPLASDKMSQYSTYSSHTSGRPRAKSSSANAVVPQTNWRGYNNCNCRERVVPVYLQQFKGGVRANARSTTYDHRLRQVAACLRQTQALRDKAGMTNVHVYRNADNPREPIVWSEVSDVTKAREALGGQEIGSAKTRFTP